MTSLADIQSRWLDLFWALAARNLNQEAAGPFLSVAPEGYDPGGGNSILYVGKATALDWNKAEFLKEPTVEERRRATRRFLKEEVQSGEYCSPFWKFALAISGTPTLQNLVWTNLLKIGAMLGNPSGDLAREQRALAIETLRLEMMEYRPTLAVFVTANYEFDMVKSAPTIFDSRDEKPWIEERADMWWRPRTERLPALLWLAHPQGKSNSVLQTWESKARQLITSR